MITRLRTFARQRSQVERDQEHEWDLRVRAEALTQKAIKDFESWADEEESRIPGAESKQVAEEHRCIALGLRRCAEHLQKQPESSGCSDGEGELRAALQGFLDAWLNCDRKLTEADWEEMDEAERTARAVLDASPSTSAHKEGGER